MKLLTKKIKTKLKKYPLYSQENKGENAIVICKFFTPVGGFTWYVTEGQEENEEDYRFFGLVINGDDREFGYFLLSELESIRLPFNLSIERDLYFESCKLKNIK